jgi:ribosomal protein S18 acetylase RimI-like enzyme
LRRFLSEDPLDNAYMIYDMDHGGSAVEFWLALDRALEGVLLIYRGDVFTCVWLQGGRRAARTLCRKVDLDSAVFQVPVDLSDVVEESFPISAKYLEDVETVAASEAGLRISHGLKRLTRDDAQQLARLRSNRFQGTKEKPTFDQLQEQAEMFIARDYVVGAFDGDKLVSTAASHLRLSFVWVIGGVFTDPEYRGRGFGIGVTSAVLREAMANVDYAMLLVWADNLAAKKMYGKLGFRTIGQRAWLDMGTGLAP